MKKIILQAADELPGEAPQDEAQATVGVQADGYLAWWVKLTLQLNGAAESADGCMRHLKRTQRHKKNDLFNLLKHRWLHVFGYPLPFLLL